MHDHNKSLHLKTRTAIIWNAAQIFITKSFSIVVTLILAIILKPEDFGLIALLTVFMMLSGTIVAAGLKEALIRMPRIRSIHLNTVFYTNIFIGILIYFLFFLSAPLVASFYNEPILTELIRVVSIVIFFNSFAIIQDINFTRKLDFKTPFKIAIPANIIAGLVAIILAYFEFGVWALIAQMIIFPLLQMLLFWLLGNWRPRIQFSFKVLKSLFSISYKLLLTSLIGITTQNSYSLLIAKYFSTGILGVYFLANKIKDIVLSQIISTIENVTFPALSSIQNDEARFLKAQRSIVRLTTFIIFPVLILLAVLSDLLFQIIFKQEWHEGADYLKYMCIASLAFPSIRFNTVLLKVKGKASTLLNLEVITNVLLLAFLIISIQFGMHAILISLIIYSFTSAFLFTFFTRKISGYGALEQIADTFPALLLSLSTGFITLFIVEQSLFPQILNLVFAGSLSIMIYIFLAIKLKLYAAEYIVKIIKEKI